MKKNIIISVAIISFLGSLSFILIKNREKPLSELDTFAMCLADQGVIMYGSKYCHWCQQQKADFGDAWRFIEYVECTEEKERCEKEGISGVPVWTLADGKQLLGYQELERLSEETGCGLPEIRI